MRALVLAAQLRILLGPPIDPTASLSRAMTTSSPAFAPPRLSPLIHHVPGATPASQAACQRLLLENHRRFDIFERNGIFHNHLAVRCAPDARTPEQSPSRR
jgi:hypothetical protein